MTDFYTAARNRENQIIQDTRQQLENYKIEIKRCDGVYRHVFCCKPGQGNICSFHVVTWPNHVTIVGDWCKAYTLEWVKDMLTQFLNDDEPNVGYWAEKVQTRTSLETTKTEFVLRCLFDYLDYWEEDDMDAGTLESCKYDLEQWIDINDPLLIEHLNTWRFCYQEKDSGHLLKVEPFYSFDFEDACWDVWTEEWIRVCELLRWTACKVAAMEVAK